MWYISRYQNRKTISLPTWNLSFWFGGRKQLRRVTCNPMTEVPYRVVWMHARMTLQSTPRHSTHSTLPMATLHPLKDTTRPPNHTYTTQYHTLGLTPPYDLAAYCVINTSLALHLSYPPSKSQHCHPYRQFTSSINIWNNFGRTGPDKKHCICAHLWLQCTGASAGDWCRWHKWRRN